MITRRSVLAGAAAATVTAGIASATRSARATERRMPQPWPKYGISVGGRSLNRTPADRDRELDDIAGLGCKVVRHDAGHTAMTDGRLGAYIDAVRTRGMESFCIVGGTFGPDKFPIPDDQVDYADAVVAFCAARGVRFFEIGGNEPNGQGWQPEPWAEQVRAVYDWCESLHKQATFFAGAVAIGKSAMDAFHNFIVPAIPALEGRFDGFSVHAADDVWVKQWWQMWTWLYGPIGLPVGRLADGTPVTVDDTVRAVLDRTGNQTKPIILSEHDVSPNADPSYRATITTHALTASTPMVCAYTAWDDDIPGYGIVGTPAGDAYKAIAAPAAAA
jgi:hypothetical protein